MRLALQYPKMALFGALAIMYVVLRLAVPQPWLSDIMNSLFLGITGTVTVVFAPLAWRAFQDRAFNRVSQLTFGILLTWVSLFGAKLVGHVSQTYYPDISLFLSYLAIIGGVLHVTAAGMDGPEWRYHRSLLLCGLLSGLALFVITATMRLFNLFPFVT